MRRAAGAERERVRPVNGMGAVSVTQAYRLQVPRKYLGNAAALQAGSQAMQALAGRVGLPVAPRAAAAKQLPQRPAAGLARLTARAPVAPSGPRRAAFHGGSSTRRGRPLLASRERAGASSAQPLEQYAGRYGAWTLTDDDRREVWAYRTCLAVVAAGALLASCRACVARQCNVVTSLLCHPLTAPPRRTDAQRSTPARWRRCCPRTRSGAQCCAVARGPACR